MKLLSITALVTALLATSPAVLPVAAADFSYDAKAGAIVMDGNVYHGDGARFSAQLRAHPDARTLILAGYNFGGSYSDALTIARGVRAHHLATVSGYVCSSACSFIWLVGAQHSTQGSAYPEMHLPGSRLTFATNKAAFYGYFAEFGLPKGLADYVVSHADGANNETTSLTPSLLARFGL